MPNPAIMFRVFLFFILICIVIIGVLWLVSWFWGIEFKFFTKLISWYREEKEKEYEAKLSVIQKKSTKKDGKKR